MVWPPYAATGTRRINRVSNKFLSFSGFTLNIMHTLILHDYRSIMQVLGLDSIEDRRKSFETHFIRGLLSGRIDAPHLFERIIIRVPIKLGYVLLFTCY